MKRINYASKLQKWQERRERLYKLHEQGYSITELARQEKITERSMNILLQKVKRQHVISQQG